MGSTIDLTAADGHKLSAYTAGPDGATKGLVVIQEIFGSTITCATWWIGSPRRATRSVRRRCSTVPSAGWQIGYSPDDMAKGREVRMKLSETGVMADVEAAARHLGGKRLGIVGYCYGGTVAWWGATRTQLFAAASCWYGGGIAATKNETPNCPVQMHFGEKDQSITMADVDAIRAAQPKVEVYVYAGAQHGFGCDERGSFSKPDCELAQQRTLAFFARYLG